MIMHSYIETYDAMNATGFMFASAPSTLLTFVLSST